MKVSIINNRLQPTNFRLIAFGGKKIEEERIRWKLLVFTFSIRFSHASISTLHLFIFRAHFIFRLPVTPLMRFPSAQFDLTSLNRDNCPSWQVYCSNRENTRINELLIDNATDQGVFQLFFSLGKGDWLAEVLRRREAVILASWKHSVQTSLTTVASKNHFQGDTKGIKT